MPTATTTKRRTAAKSTTSKKATTPIEEVKVEEVKAPKVEKKVFKDSDGIPCRSITQGALYMEGAKTHMLYEWVEYGDVTMVEYADLAAAVRTKSWFMFSPAFIVEDDDFIEQNVQLKKFYDENYSVHDLEKILRLPIEEMKEEITALPKSAVESLKSLAATSITEGTLDSVKRIKVLDEMFDTNLNVLAEFEH